MMKFVFSLFLTVFALTNGLPRYRFSDLEDDYNDFRREYMPKKTYDESKYDDYLHRRVPASFRRNGARKLCSVKFLHSCVRV